MPKGIAADSPSQHYTFPMVYYTPQELQTRSRKTQKEKYVVV